LGAKKLYKFVRVFDNVVNIYSERKTLQTIGKGFGKYEVSLTGYIVWKFHEVGQKMAKNSSGVFTDLP